MAEQRAVREFTVSGDPWPVVEKWAPVWGYELAEEGEGRRLYSKGTGFISAIRKLDLALSGDQLHLEAWCHATIVARIMSAFILPREITIESGGFAGHLPRRLGREEINPLLGKFGQPAIE